MNKRRNDILLIASLLLLAAILFAASALFAKKGAYVLVSVNAEKYASYPLDEDRTVTIQTQYGTNVLVIKDKRAYISEADCPDKLCVHFSAVEKEGQTIICLPHKLVVEIKGSDGSGLDEVAN